MPKCFLVIRFSSDYEKDLKLDITKLPVHNITPAWLRRMCRDLRGKNSREDSGADSADGGQARVDLHKCKLRFIRNGRMLQGMHWSEFEMELRSIKDAVLQAGCSVDPQQQQQQQEDTGENDKYVYVQCLIGIAQEEAVDVQQELVDDRNAMSPQGEQAGQPGAEDAGAGPVIGFDRLRTLGFSEEEIGLLRQQFQSRMNLRNAMGSGPGGTQGPGGAGGAANGSATGGAAEDEYYENGEEVLFEDVTGETNEGGNGAGAQGRPSSGASAAQPLDPRELEERWMETNALEDASTGIVNSISAWKYNVDLLLGVSIGFLFGVFGVLLLIGLDKKTFNPRIKRAIFAGFVSNFIFGIIRGW